MLLHDRVDESSYSSIFPKEAILMALPLMADATKRFLDRKISLEEAQSQVQKSLSNIFDRED